MKLLRPRSRTVGKVARVGDQVRVPSYAGVWLVDEVKGDIAGLKGAPGVYRWERRDLLIVVPERERVDPDEFLTAVERVRRGPL